MDLLFSLKLYFPADNIIKSAKFSGRMSGGGHRYFWMRWLDIEDPNRVTFGEGLKAGQNILTDWHVDPSFVLHRIEKVDLPGLNAQVG